MSILVAEHIRKSFDANEVLKDISVDIPKNKISALMGASGAGKSTLLYILGSLEKPTSGRVILNIDDEQSVDYSKIGNIELASLRNRYIGFVFQFHHLLPEFSVLENIMLPALILGTKHKIAQENARTLCEKLGISHIVNQQTTTLSGGEAQRVAFARSLINSPKIILADEPTGNLDSNNAKKLISLIRQINAEFKTTFLISTHSNEVTNAADGIYVMKDGCLSAS